MKDVLATLAERELLHQSTDIEGLREHLKHSRQVYTGFDPTADSLTVGNLIPIIILRHFQLAGHTPVVVLGGATGLIGDPSGKSAERQLLNPDTIASNVSSQARIFKQLLVFNCHTNGARMFNNLDWFQSMTLLDALREIGKYCSVNEMVKRDSIRERLNREQGLSYTEFSYSLLQSYDFQHLYQQYGVTVQLGGSDQWGNILPGVDLVRRKCQQTVYGLTCRLVTKSDGSKFGKSEEGAIWLTDERTSPYALYQFFLNTADEDVGRFLRQFTFLPLAAIEEIEHIHLDDPGKRHAQHTLAREVTDLVHGLDAGSDAAHASHCLFTGDLSQLPLHLLLQVMNGVPTSSHPLSQLREQPINAVDLLCMTAVCAGKREAREMLGAGAILVNGQRMQTSDSFGTDNLLYGKVAAIRRGKKNWFMAVFE